jgi:hypothetical protein
MPSSMNVLQALPLMFTHLFSSHQMLSSEVTKCHHYRPYSTLKTNQSANPVVHKPSLVTKFKFVEYLSKKTLNFEVLTEITVRLLTYRSEETCCLYPWWQRQKGPMKNSLPYFTQKVKSQYLEALFGCNQEPLTQWVHLTLCPRLVGE